MKRNERGQVLPLAVALVTVVCLVSALAVSTVAERVTARARVQTAADAAALAVASTGDAVKAAEVAHANGAKVRKVEWPDGDALVEVEIGERKATAHARRH